MNIRLAYFRNVSLLDILTVNGISSDGDNKKKTIKKRRYPLYFASWIGSCPSRLSQNILIFFKNNKWQVMLIQHLNVLNKSSVNYCNCPKLPFQLLLANIWIKHINTILSSWPDFSDKVLRYLSSFNQHAVPILPVSRFKNCSNTHPWS